MSSRQRPANWTVGSRSCRVSRKRDGRSRSVMRLPWLHRESHRIFVAQRKRVRVDTAVRGRRLTDGSMADVRAVEQLGLEKVVDLAPKFHVVHCGRAADAVWADMVELDERALATTVAVARNVSAATTIADVHRSLDLS